MAPKIEDYNRPPPVLGWRKIKGKCVYASRLCKNGEIEKAKAYLTEFGIPFPPFSEDPKATAERLENGNVAPVPSEPRKSEGMAVSEAVPACTVRDAVRNEAAKAFLNACPVDLPNVDAVAALIEIIKNDTGSSPIPAASLKATITGFCRNPRLVAIRLENGEEASMWASRKGYRLRDSVEVVLERGEPGVNAVYQEVRKPV